MKGALPQRMQSSPLTTDSSRLISKTSRRISFILAAAAALFVFLFFVRSNDRFLPPKGTSDYAAAPTEQCAQAAPLAPKHNAQLSAVFNGTFTGVNEGFAVALAAKLSQLVQIESVSFDDMKHIPVDGPDGDERRRGFVQMRDAISALWPEVHQKLRRTIVNRYGLVFEWAGSDAALKPVLLTAHLDTVPVLPDSLGRWTHPPFAGVVADGHVWGRGASDCKAQITSIMDAVDLLIKHGHSPRRTVVIAFGFDEEISGGQGAATIATHLAAVYGRHNFEFILDEGSSIESQYGASFAHISTGEKGYMDVSYTVNTAGGHSSIPPRHTSIGFLAKIIDALEEHQSRERISDKNLAVSPLFNELQCLASYGPSIPKILKKAVDAVANAKNQRERQQAQKNVVKILSSDRGKRALLMTTQAIDIISGGIKVNALPEFATAIGNYRIHPDESVESTEAAIRSVVEPVARKYNLTFIQKVSTGETVYVDSEGNMKTKMSATAASLGTVTVATLQDSLEPAPITPANGKPFQLVAGTVRHSMRRGDEKLYVTPSIPTGNSDTRHFWNLSKHIFRFTPLRDHDAHNIHTVDEKCRVDDLVQSAGFFFELLRNADEAQF